MTALRQEALQIVNDMPEYLLRALVDNLQHFKERQVNSLEIEKIDSGEVDPKKASAFAAMEEWIYRNREILSKIDPEREREIAMEEKYDSFN